MSIFPGVFIKKVIMSIDFSQTMCYHRKWANVWMETMWFYTFGVITNTWTKRQFGARLNILWIVFNSWQLICIFWVCGVSSTITEKSWLPLVAWLKGIDTQLWMHVGDRMFEKLMHMGHLIGVHLLPRMAMLQSAASISQLFFPPNCLSTF